MSDQASKVGVAVGRDGEARITFLPPVVMNDGSNYTRIPIRIEARGLSAESVIELEGWGGWTTGFLAFFDAIAAEWRGWEGVKEWRDDGDYQTDRIAATHDRLGTIELKISTSPRIGFGYEGEWELEFVVRMDPGAVEATARAMRHLLGSPAVG